MSEEPRLFKLWRQLTGEDLLARKQPLNEDPDHGTESGNTLMKE